MFYPRYFSLSNKKYLNDAIASLSLSILILKITMFILQITHNMFHVVSFTLTGTLFGITCQYCLFLVYYYWAKFNVKNPIILVAQIWLYIHAALSQKVRAKWPQKMTSKDTFLGISYTLFLPTRDTASQYKMW